MIPNSRNHPPLLLNREAARARQTNPPPKQILRNLVDAQEARNISDYQAVSHITEQATMHHISRAQELLNVAEQILKP